MFLNVDLNLKSSSGIQHLLVALQANMFVLSSSSEITGLELREQSNHLNDCLFDIASIIEGLDGSAREEWDRCELKCLNIGVSVKGIDHSETLHILNPTMTLMARFGCEVSITTYSDELIKR